MYIVVVKYSGFTRANFSGTGLIQKLILLGFSHN